MRSEPRANGAGDDFALELDQLVAEEVAALRTPPPEATVDALLDDLAARLKDHPDRAALLERLCDAVLGAPAPAAPLAPPDPDPVPGDT